MGADKQVDDIKRLVVHLEQWARWHQGYCPDLGHAHHAAVCETGGKSVYSSWDDFEEGVDRFRFLATDAAVDDLAPAQRGAVHKRYGICAVWRFPRANYTYEHALLDAHMALLKLLAQRHVVI